MFTISAKGVYGISALLYLTDNYQSGPVQIKDISSTQNIPQHYLEQLLVILKKGGLVKSFRGAKGGYALALSPNQISILNILEALEGPLKVIRDEETCKIDFFWNGLSAQIERYLATTIMELLEEKKRRGENFIYTI